MVDGGDIVGAAIGAAVGIYVLKKTGLLDNKRRVTFRNPIKFEPIKPLGLKK